MQQQDKSSQASSNEKGNRKRKVICWKIKRQIRNVRIHSSSWCLPNNRTDHSWLCINVRTVPDKWNITLSSNPMVFLSHRNSSLHQSIVCIRWWRWWWGWWSNDPSISRSIMQHLLFTTFVTLYLVTGVGSVAFAWKKYSIIHTMHS